MKRVSVLLCLGFLACSQELPEDGVGVKSEALSPCNETVPANRNVDGIPAYAQCASIQDGPIFSNNGVDTSATSMGSDWVKTQYSGGYQCTELAHRYLYFRWKVKWIPNGNAGNWCDTQPPANSGVVQTMMPVHGDIMVLAGGSCGADATTGHVNVVDTVDMASGKLVAVEQNRAGRSPYMMSCGKCFLHVMANDGKPMAITPPAAAGAPAVPPPAANSGAAGRPDATPGGAAGAGALPPRMTPPVGPARAGAAAPVVMPPPMAAAVPAATAPVVAPAPSAPVAVMGAAGTPALAAVTPQMPAATRSAAPAASGCSVTDVGPASARSSLAFAGLWMLGMSFRRRRRALRLAR